MTPDAISTVLPPDAAKALQQAAKTPITASDPNARSKAVERATALVKRKYPQFFKTSF